VITGHFCHNIFTGHTPNNSVILRSNLHQMLHSVKRPVFTVATILLLATAALAKITPDNKLPQKSGIAFKENKGQVHDQNYEPRPDVLFGASAGPMTFLLRNKGVSYQLYRTDKWKETTDDKTGDIQKEIELQTIYRVDLNWAGANAAYKVITDDILAGYDNYYLPNCPQGALYVRSYKGVTLHELYKGINLHYYAKDGQLKHDYIVAPGADYRQIQLTVDGASVGTTAEGSLILTTPLGKIEEGKPVVFQRGRILRSGWVVRNNILSFEIEDHDPRYELVIDPVTRVWGTYYGGSADEYGNGCATDRWGNVYISGRSDSNTPDAIATMGSHQQTTGGFSEAFLAKLNSKGQRLWGTYYGGSKAEVSSSCAADAFGNVFMAGTTSSNNGNVISTPGAHQENYYGSSADAFLVKFNNNGVRQWGTYYGSYGWDIAWSCTSDPSGNVYMAGETDSGSMIATLGSHQQYFGGSYSDGFLVKFDSVGVRQWGTYYGGNDDEDARGCATDASGNVYLTGSTYNIPGTVISTAGSHQPNFGGGSLDAYLVKFDAAGVRQWGTYYGGYYYDYGYSCTTDASGNVYLSGNTNGFSGTLIATPGSFQQNFVGGSTDAFLVKFSSGGVRQWSTYYGNYGDDDGFSCSTDPAGNVYLGGRTSSSGGMSSTQVFQQSYAGGTYDAYVVKFNTIGNRLWATYYGSSGTDYGRFCAADPFGSVFMVGETTSGTGLGSNGCHQDTSGGLLDAFLVKISDCTALNPKATADSVVCMGNSINFTVTLTGTGSYSYTWVGPDNYSSTQKDPVITNASTLHVGVYTLTVFNGACGEMTTTEVKEVATCAGMNEVNGINTLCVYPNPANATLNIELKYNAGYHFKDLLGRTIATGRLSEGKNSLDIGEVEKGCYMLLISDGLVSKTLKVLVE
jgi:hypothetical protein